MDDAVCDRFGDGGLDVAQLLHGGIELCGKAGNGLPGKGFIGGVAGKFQPHEIISSHMYTSSIRFLQFFQFRQR